MKGRKLVASVLAAAMVLSGTFACNPTDVRGAESNTPPGKPTELKTEMLEYAYGLNTKNPAFSWVVNDEDKNEVQTAYRIVVSGTSALTGDVLDTGWVESAESSFVHAEGLENKLQDNELYYWQVQTKDKDGAESPLSDARPFMTGIGEEWQSLNGIWATPNAEAEGAWTDYTVEQTMSVTQTALAVLLRMDADNNGYIAQFRTDNNTIKLHKLNKGTANNTPFHTIKLNNYNIKLEQDKDFEAKIEVFGTDFTFYVKSGDKYIETETVSIENQGAIKSGKIGYRTGSSESGTVSSLKVTKKDTQEVLIESPFKEGQFPNNKCKVQDGRLIVGNGVGVVVYTDIEEGDLTERSRFSFFRSPKLTIENKDSIDKAIVSSACRGTGDDHGIIYDIWMNGSCLGAGSARELNNVGKYSGGSGYRQVYYNSYDVTELLKEGGSNVISALGNSRDDARSILVQMTVFYEDGTKKIITNSGVENSGWKTLDGTNAFGDDNSGIATGYVTVLHDNINMEKYPAGWQNVEFDDSKWASAKVTFQIADHKTGNSGAVLYPFSSENTLRVVTNEPTKKIYENNSGNIVVDLGKEIIGGLKVDLDSAVRQQITVRMGEELNANGTVKHDMSALQGKGKYEDKWTLKEGKNQFETITMRNFRYVELIGLDEATKKGMTANPDCMKGWAMQQPFDDSDSSFQASDGSAAATLMNRLYELSKYTIKATNQDVFVDSQARERAPYEGDLLVNSNTSYAVSDNYSLARHSNEWLMDNQTWPNDYRIFSVEMAYWDYVYTGNTDSIRECYNGLKAKMTAQIQSEDSATGLIHAKGGQAGESALIDWPTSERDGYRGSFYDVVLNSEYVGIYHDMALISSALGHTDDAKNYQAKSDKLKETLLKYAFDEENGCFYDSLDSGYNATKHSSTHATAYALNYGVYKDQKMADRMCEFVYNKCKDEFKGSVYVTYFILEGLYRGNHGEMAEKILTNPKTGTDVKTYAALLDSLNCTITPEAWGHKWKGNMTMSHPWGASPGCSIVQGMFGILPTSAGFNTFDIKLQPGEIASASVKAPTVKGPVSVSYTNGNQEGVCSGKIQATVEIPANTKARVYLPVENARLASLMVDGEKQEATVREGKFLSIELGSGLHELAVSPDETPYTPEMSIKASAGKTDLDVEDVTEIDTRILDQFGFNLAKDVTLTYKSSDERIVKADKEGNVTAVGRGEAVVTVTAKYTVNEGQSVEKRAEIKFTVTAALKNFEVRLKGPNSIPEVGKSAEVYLAAVYTDGIEEEIAADQVTFEAGNDAAIVQGNKVTCLKEKDIVIKAVTSAKFDEMNAKMKNVEMKIAETYRFDKESSPLSSCQVKEGKLYAGTGTKQATKKTDNKSGNVVSGKFIVENVAANVAFNADDNGNNYYFWQFRKNDKTLKRHDGGAQVIGDEIPIELQEENSFRIATVNKKIYTWLNGELIDICDTVSGYAESGGFGVRNGNSESAFFTDLSVGNGNAYLITSTISVRPVDKEALEAAINRKKNLKETDYTAASWKVLQDALTKANNILESETTTQEKVNAATAELREAYAKLIWVDKAGLRDAIARAAERNEADYTAESWAAMKTVLDKAKDVEGNPNALQTDVDAATYSLSDALRNLKTKAEAAVNKNALNAAIERAKARKEADYTAASWKVLAGALQTATEAKDNPAATQEAVDAATRSLRDALEKLVWVDKSGLKDAIDRAGQRDEEKYKDKPDEWAAMQAALEEAKTVYENPDSVQTQVDAATLKLSEALRALDPAGTINKNALEAAIARTKNLNAADYTATSWEALQKALQTATEAKDSSDISQDEVNKATDGLRKALEGLVWIDKSGLKDAIGRAGQRNEADYTAESWAAMQTTLDNAKEVDENDDAVQEAVDAATYNLSEALRKLELKPVINKNALIAAIKRTEDLAEVNYTATSWKVLKEALEKATAANENKTASQEEVNAATQALRDAIAALIRVDKAGLKAAIDRAKERKEAEYTKESWTAMQKALTDAKAVYDNHDATQEKVDQATYELSEALRQLVYVEAEKAALDSAISEAKTLKKENYTPEAWSAFQKAVAEAEAILNNPDATKEQRAEAAASLKKAIEEVKKNPAKDDNKQPAVIKVSRIRISGPSQKIAEGKKVKLTAQVSPSNAADKGVIWKTSNKKVATVNSKGVVTMQKKSGGKSVTITATARDGSNVKATYKITSMKGKVTKVTIPGKKTRTVKAGKKLKLTAKVKAQKNANKKLKWTSSNTKYAKVSSSGKVTTKKAGRGKSVKITAAATDGSGKKYTVKIKIK